jgi:two-component system cell cycle response regulator
MAPAVQLRGEHGVAKSEESTTRNKKRPPSHASASELKESAGLESRDATGEEMEPPTDFSDTARSKSDTARRKPVLITLDGRRVSERFVITGRQTILGRDTSVDVHVSDGEVSRQHCVVEWTNFEERDATDPICRIEDLGSTNGTFLNGSPVKEAVSLRDGDQIRVGRTVLGFFLKDERVLELDQLLLSMALNDSLTGLYKREFFFGELQREFDRSRRHGRTLSLAVVDLDYFKAVNDRYGHLKGDEALRQVADAIRATLREGDLCARFGGEEFAIIFPETDGEGAYGAGERFRRAVESKVFRLGPDLELRITVSVGIATLGEHHRDKMQLLEEADHALYLAKAAGRNRTILAPGRNKLDENTGKAFGR